MGLHARRLLIFAFISLSITACQTTSSLPPGISAVQATLLYGTVALAPSVTRKGYFYQYTGSPLKGDSWLAKVEMNLKPGASAPAAIFLHGCGAPARHAPRIFAMAGYTVFAPDSFARPGRSAQCGHGGMDSRVAMRQEEARYALSQIKKFPWVDPKHLVLAGFSEGSQAVAAWGGREFKAHVLIGTDCRHNGGMPSAPDGVRVLNVVGTEDSWGYGLGCSLTDQQSSSGSVVKRYQGARHNLFYWPEAVDDLVAFLESLRR